ncbi:MAG TPA: CHASE3 domain-containing protein, partial [Polyangia bacterium]
MLSTVTLLTLTVGVVSMLRSQMMGILSALDADGDRAERLQRDIQGRMQAMLNQEVGLRGFLATGDDAFLEPYRS